MLARCEGVVGINIGFIGVGNMASAIIPAVMQLGFDVFLHRKDPQKPLSFENSDKTIMCVSAQQLCEQCDMIFLAVKPQTLPEIVKEIKQSAQGKCIVSIAAGVTSATLAKWLPGADIIRVMPNTPITMGFGATAVARPEKLSNQALLDTVINIFSSRGICVIIDENKINEMTAISGSSPAYFFYIIKVMVENAVHMGIDKQDAINMAAQSMLGSAQMLLNGEKNAEQLIKQVCSPGGTTLAALDVFDQSGLSATIYKAMKACTDRAYELGRGPD